jgi:hypothetical protein
VEVELIGYFHVLLLFQIGFVSHESIPKVREPFILKVIRYGQYRFRAITLFLLQLQQIVMSVLLYEVQLANGYQLIQHFNVIFLD